MPVTGSAPQRIATRAARNVLFFRAAAQWLSCRQQLINFDWRHEGDRLFCLIGELDAHAELSILMDEAREGGA